MIGDGALADLDDKGNEWDVLMVMTTSSTSGTFITAAQGRPMSKVTHDFREEHQGPSDARRRWTQSIPQTTRAAGNLFREARPFQTLKRRKTGDARADETTE
ncbi:uncharacterized protein LOC112346776 isoform X4 [Selaginella moellendorffii]|uniref:uncharacterized protein LOC112346776 isoform X4 n=1 Tax=Selaginella moellendorffii TaxID=88036 RepID=UPI000D1C3CB4|nr:uncharacterized protein LOC112346776 isoform X4 [Selaginella moellendorffii]|eukprot:XP_024532160.1 uncharacterized protein LOC112346776 isoform X4 [Selaginella moellendorffii]